MYIYCLKLRKYSLKKVLSFLFNLESLIVKKKKRLSLSKKKKKEDDEIVNLIKGLPMHKEVHEWIWSWWVLCNSKPAFFNCLYFLYALMLGARNMIAPVKHIKVLFLYSRSVQYQNS